MTKTYLGSEQYEIHLNSGKTLILTQQDLEDLQACTKELECEIEELKHSLDELNGELEAAEADANDFEDSFLQKSELLNEIDTIVNNYNMSNQQKIDAIRMSL